MPRADVYAVVMAGGAGTRFWPASRRLTPKQLLPLARDPNEPLIAATVRRIAPLVPPERVYIATGAHLVDATARALPEVPRANLLAEPVPRNTAPCIGWASATIAARSSDPDAIVVVLPSDHFIANEDAFRDVLARATEAARRGAVTTVGVVPTRAETGYGYIEIGPTILSGVHAGVRFVEKPDRARAEAYVAGKKHLWNAGMFFFKASVMRAAIAAHLPALAEGLGAIEEDAGALASVFPKLPSISIDHGVMEKLDVFAVVPGDFGWSDVGSWESAWELAAKDAEGNALADGAIAVGARGNLVRAIGAKGKVVALVGVEGLVVVDTGDALLVMARDKAQDVRAVVDQLRERGDLERV